MNIEDSISKLKGVGGATCERLALLGIFTIKDLITHFPKEFEDRTETREIFELIEGEKNTFRAMLASNPVNIKINGKTLTKVTAFDGTGRCEIVWFNQPYLKMQLKQGDEFIFTGKVDKKYGKISVASPIYEKYGENNLMTGAVVTKYASTFKLTQQAIKKMIRKALDEAKDELLDDKFPSDIREKYNLCSYYEALCNIHFPCSPEEFFDAKRRLIFEEFLTTQLALSFLKNKVKTDKYGISFENTDISSLLFLLPFELTNAQLSVIEEIKKDMNSNKIMNRLVQGDVGSGKTIVALAALIIAVQNGYQGAMMAPTEILAIQHYEFIKKYMDLLDIKVEVLVGSIKAKEKKEVYERLKNGEIDIIVGTHALIQKGVEFKNLGIVVTDEQHRFGVSQRQTLSKKGKSPDVLVMTATPIPRTLGLILYGDLDISIIDELPKGRQKIDTLVVNTSYYDRMYSFIKEEIKAGRQAYIICPMVEDSEVEGMTELNSVTTYTKMLKDNYLKDINVELIHGKMKAKDKNDIMDTFMAGKIDVLVSTTVIEVGINNPNASIMVIENAERFGLSQLHQLRGRVGRGKYKSYCILVSDSKTKTSKTRLNTLKATGDGFIIAEKDLELRGPGEFFGTRQHGIPEFKIANLYTDVNILKEVQVLTDNILSSDPMLLDDKYEKIKEDVAKILEYQVL